MPPRQKKNTKKPPPKLMQSEQYYAEPFTTPTTEFIRNKIMKNHYRFVSENFRAKIEQFTLKIEDLNLELWSMVPLKTKRQEHYYYIVLVSTYSELFYWTLRGMEMESDSDHLAHIECDLFNLFEEYHIEVLKCRDSYSTDYSTFTDMIYIRDKVIDFVRAHFTVLSEMWRGENGDTYVPDHWSFKYQPYDYEWLSSNVNDGPYHSSFAKYLYMSRLNQLELSCKRASLVAMKRQKDTDFMRNLRYPLPKTTRNPLVITSVLKDEEDRLRQDYVRLLKILRFDERDRGSVKYLNSMEVVNDLCGAIRLKKKSVFDEILYFKDDIMVEKWRVIGVLTDVETLLLILQKVYAPYIDSKRGFLGVSIPSFVIKALIGMVQMVSEECFSRVKLPECIKFQWAVIRLQAFSAVKFFYQRRARDSYNLCDRQFRPLRKESGNFALKLSINDLPEALKHHSSRMMWHLQEQETEINRLHLEIFKAQIVVTKYSDVLRYRLNECIGAFSYYFDWDFLENAFPHSEVVEAANNSLKQELPQKQIGHQLVQIVLKVAEDNNAIPTGFQEPLEAEFKAILKGKLLNGERPDQLASRFADLLFQTIEIVNLRAIYKYERNQKTNDAGSKLAVKIVRAYMTYVRTFSTKSTRNKREIIKEVPCKCHERCPTKTLVHYGSCKLIKDEDKQNTQIATDEGTRLGGSDQPIEIFTEEVDDSSDMEKKNAAMHVIPESVGKFVLEHIIKNTSD